MPLISIYLGICIGLLASFIQSLGLTIQRKSHVINHALECQRRKEHQRLWLLGVFIFIFSNIIGSVVQIASLPVVILAPLGAMSLLWNAILAHMILGENFSPQMVFGTILIAGGALLIANFGVVIEPTRSLEDLLELSSRPVFLIYFSVLCASVSTCLVITHFVEYSMGSDILCTSRSSVIETELRNSLPPFSPTPDILLCTEQTPLLGRKSHNPLYILAKLMDIKQSQLNNARLLVALSYASFSGIISGICLVFAKSGTELVLLVVRGQNHYGRWQTWFLVSVFAISALMQLWYLHKSLVLAGPTLVCPSAFCFYSLSSIFNGLIYFDQLPLLSCIHLVMIGLGIFILLTGVCVVSTQSANSREAETEGQMRTDGEPTGVQDIPEGLNEFTQHYRSTTRNGGVIASENS